MRKIVLQSFIIVLCVCMGKTLNAELRASAVRVGTKEFTENVILGEIVSLLLQQEGIPVVPRKQLGGTRVLWSALLNEDIDMYPEYTGTLINEILAERAFVGLQEALSSLGIRMSMPLGFNNTYAIGMKAETAQQLGIAKISDLRDFPGLALGFTNEFMNRKDGWPGLRDYYHLPQRNVQGLDHTFAYRGIESGTIQATDLYSTDADIKYYNLVILKDDLHYFPDYQAVLLYRADLADRWPNALKVISQLKGCITESKMRTMNAQAKIEKIPESVIAADFLTEEFGARPAIQIETISQRILQRTKEHILLVVISLAGAIFLSIPLGILAAKRPAIGHTILSITGIIQTIPSLALLVFMIPLLGVGSPPAIFALFLYSLLPIIQNTFTGLHNIPSDIRETAEVLGLPPLPCLLLIELPLASRSILAGIKTSAVLNVGTATLGALIGAGGYGQPILTGIRLNTMSLILEGAVPAAVLAILVQWLFDLTERYLVPKGLQINHTHQ